MDPATTVALLGLLLGLGGAGVTALWKIANGLGQFEARTSLILKGIQTMLKDHEDRLRNLER